MEIQRATVDDAREILILQKLAWQSEAAIYDLYDLPPLIETLAEMEADLEQQVVLKVVDGDRIVGSVTAYEEQSTCHIGRLIVHPDHQNRDLGTRLMHAIEAAFPQVDRYELFTGHKSERNLYLYGKLGYREFKREPVRSKLVLVFLEKPRSRP